MSHWLVVHTDVSSQEDFLQSPPSDVDNYDVWCERCQKVHKHFTYTREDHQRVIAQAVKNLSDEIDRRALESVMRAL